MRALVLEVYLLQPSLFYRLFRRYERSWSKKTRMMGLPGRERSLTISSAVLIQHTIMTDRRTDRHRATAKTALTLVVPVVMSLRRRQVTEDGAAKEGMVLRDRVPRS